MDATATGTELTTTPGRALERARRLERVRETAQRSKADRTLREYARAWRGFAEWCEREGRPALDANPETAAAAVSEYIRDRADAGRKRASVEQDLAAIAFRYVDAGHPSPSRHAGVRRFMEGLRRELAGFVQPGADVLAHPASLSSIAVSRASKSESSRLSSTRSSM